MSQVMNTSIGTISQVSITFVAKEESKQEDGYKYTDHYTKHTHEHIDKSARIQKRRENVNKCLDTYTQESEK